MKQYQEPQTDFDRELVKVAESYKIDLLFLSKEFCDLFGYRNNGHSSGCSSIYLGAYFDNNSIKTAAFFHELGHILIARSKISHILHKASHVKYEALCWKIGFASARKTYKITFNETEMKYAYNCLMTYQSEIQ